MANGWRSFFASIPPLSPAFTAATEWIRCRRAPCRRHSGRPPWATGWTPCSRPIQGRRPFSPTPSSKTLAPFSPRMCQAAGPLPAIRIGGQPYGILPTTAFSRIQWFPPDEGGSPSFWAISVQPAPPARRRLDQHEPERGLGRKGRRPSSDAAGHRRLASFVGRVLFAKRREPRPALQHVQPLCAWTRLAHRAART